MWCRGSQSSSPLGSEAPNKGVPPGEKGPHTEMSLEPLITTYGYPLVLAGTFLEGETILVIAGFLAHRGYLSLPLVILAAFAGTFAGDQMFFYLGRNKGMDFLATRPAWKNRSERTFKLLRHHQTAVILGFRFLYGLRTVTPFIIGASGVAPLRFFLFNGLGALVWAALVGSAGFLFGQLLEGVLSKVHRYERWVLLAMALTGTPLWLWNFYRDRRRHSP